MKYARQHPSVGGGSTDIVTGRDAPNMGKTRNFEERNISHSDNSCDDVFVIEPPPVETHSPYFAKTTGSPKTANHIRRSSGGDFDQLRHCRTSLPPPHTAQQGRRLRLVLSLLIAVWGWTMTLLLSPPHLVTPS